MVRAVDRVYTRLRADILDGVHPPGARLGEAELAERTGSSRTPVREALRRLEVEGLVEVLPHRGARVPDWTPEDLEEIYDLRMLLEGAAAAAPPPGSSPRAPTGWPSCATSWNGPPRPATARTWTGSPS